LVNVPAIYGFLHVSHAGHIAHIQPLHTPRAALASTDVVLYPGVRIRGVVALSSGGRLERPARVRFESAEGRFSGHEVETGLDGTYTSQTAFHPDLLLDVVSLLDAYGEVRKSVLLSEAVNGELRVDFLLDVRDRCATGVVVSQGGGPLSGVELYAVPLDALPPLNPIPIPAAADLAVLGVPDLSSADPVLSHQAMLRHAATTGTDGRFRVAGLSPEMAYMLLVVPGHNSNATLWIDRGAPGTTEDLGLVTVGSGGTVFGSVLGSNGGPLAEVSVSIIENKFRRPVPGTDYLPERSSAYVGGLDAIANADGSFKFINVPESNFMLVCQGNIFGPYELKDASTLGPLELVVEDPESASGVPESAVELHVLDGKGMPIAQAFALLTPIAVAGDGVDAHLREVGKYRYGRSNELGWIKMMAQPGHYDVVVKDLTGMFESERFPIEVIQDSNGVPADVRLSAASRPPAILSGTVVSPSGASVQGLQVKLTPDKREVLCSCVTLFARTNEQGQFSFGPVLWGEHRLLVSRAETGDAGPMVYPARPGEEIVIAID
jgi:hypothetical protein